MKNWIFLLALASSLRKVLLQCSDYDASLRVEGHGFQTQTRLYILDLTEFIAFSCTFHIKIPFLIEESQKHVYLFTLENAVDPFFSKARIIYNTSVQVVFKMGPEELIFPEIRAFTINVGENDGRSYLGPINTGIFMTFEHAENGSCGRIKMIVPMVVSLSKLMEGQYLCRIRQVGRNIESLVSQPVRLFHYIPPVKVPTKVSKKEGKKMTCGVVFARPDDLGIYQVDKRMKKLAYAIASTNYPGFPKAVLAIKLGDAVLPAYEIHKSLDEVRIVAPFVFQINSSRKLTCYVENKRPDYMRPERNIYIVEPFAPHDMIISSDVVHYIVDDLPTTIYCSCSGYPHPAAKWIRKGQNQLQKVDTDTLYLTVHDLFGEYKYQCECLNKAGWLNKLHTFRIINHRSLSKAIFWFNFLCISLIFTVIIPVLASRLFLVWSGDSVTTE